MPNFLPIGCIVSKVDGGPIDPPTLKCSCDYFLFEASRVKDEQ